jgi:hypothetical protein
MVSSLQTAIVVMLVDSIVAKRFTPVCGKREKNKNASIGLFKDPSSTMNH